MRRSIAPTLQDVAREVGVSAMTVSVVLNGARSATRVSETTRTRIFDAAARLRYRPNAVARGLSRRRMDTIGVVATIDGGELNLYFLEVLNGILEAAAEHEQNTTVFSVREWKEEQLKITEYCDGRVDGMIFIAPHLNADFVEALRNRHTPFVTVHNSVDLPDIYNLEANNERGAYEAVRYLIARGHRRILHFAGGGCAVLGARQRIAGYRRALEEADIPFDDSMVIAGEYSAYCGRTRMEMLLKESRSTPLPSAVFCGNDAVAFGCMEALAVHGLRVPEDISIVGFDDTLTARMTTPQLTTVRQPFRLLGRRAVEMLMPQIREETTEEDTATPESFPPRTEVYEVELVVRGSVGEPPAHSLFPSDIRSN